MNQPTVFLARHGKTSMNTGDGNDRLKGTRIDLPLTSEGKKQAERDAEKLAQFDIASIKHSPLKRSSETARIVSDRVGIKSDSADGLHPWDVGFMSGQKRDAFEPLIRWFIEHPDQPVRDGESYRDFFDTFGRELARELAAANRQPEKARVLVSHSCGLLAAEAILKGDEPKPHVGDMPGTGRIMRISKANGKWKISWL